jgi:pullulanase/glycogen debranching enzyme
MKMRTNVVVGAVAASLVWAAGLSVYAQVKRPFRNGSVWNVAMIRMKPGMETAYLNYLANDWKRNQEAAKKEGLLLSYRVLATEAHGTNDWNLLLMTEYKDLATMEANEDKADALSQKVVGDDQKQMQGYKDRSEIREVMGERLAREIVLEPKP